MKTRGNLLMASCVAALLCMPAAAMAQTPTPPVKGTAAMNSVTVTATVTAIDQKTRAVTIKTTDGKDYSFIAGDDREEPGAGGGWRRRHRDLHRSPAL